MCNGCRYETRYIKLNDQMIAEVAIERYEYDPDLDYTEDELNERLELQVKSILMTRRDFIKGNNEALEIL